MWDAVIVLVLLSVYFASNISFAIILGKRELVTLLCLSSWCLLSVFAPLLTFYVALPDLAVSLVCCHTHYCYSILFV